MMDLSSYRPSGRIVNARAMRALSQLRCAWCGQFVKPEDACICPRCVATRVLAPVQTEVVI